MAFLPWWSESAIEWAALAAGILSLAAATVGFRFRSKAQVPEVNLDKQLDELISSAQRTADLIPAIEAELRARKLTAQKLKAEADESRRLAELDSAQAEAVRELLRAELRMQSRQAKRSSFWSGAGFFMAGVLATVATTLFVRPLG